MTTCCSCNSARTANATNADFAIRTALSASSSFRSLQPRRWAPGGSFVQVEKVDDHTVTLRFAAPFPNWAPSMATTMGGDMLLPRHYLEGFHPDYTDREKLEARAKEEGFESWTQYFGQTKQSWATIVPRYNPDLPTILPFYLTQYSTDISQWQRNPYYWKVDPAGNQLPYMERIVVTNVEDLEVWNGKTLAGEYTMSGFLTSVEDFALFKENEEAGDYRVINWPTAFAAAANYEPNLTAPDMDLRPIFQDVRFRRALSLAINRDEINQVVFFGLGEPAQMTLLPTSKYYEESYAQAWAEYDPDAANTLLDEMGLQWDNRREYRLLPNGKRLSFTVEYINVETPKTRVSEWWPSTGRRSAWRRSSRRRDAGWSTSGWPPTRSPSAWRMASAATTCTSSRGACSGSCRLRSAGPIHGRRVGALVPDWRRRGRGAAGGDPGVAAAARPVPDRAGRSGTDPHRQADPAVAGGQTLDHWHGAADSAAPGDQEQRRQLPRARVVGLQRDLDLAAPPRAVLPEAVALRGAAGSPGYAKAYGTGACRRGDRERWPHTSSGG